MTKAELKALIQSQEADRVEMTRSTTDTDKFREAICSFSNDMAGRKQPGYLLIGVDEKDPTFRLPVTDPLLQQFASYRSDGAIMPLPVMNVTQQEHPDGGGDIIVVEVHPHDLPPVRYKGRTYIRIGPRKDIASEAEERVLIERRAANFPTFDATPCLESDLKRLDLDTFRQTYRPEAIAEEVIAETNRTVAVSELRERTVFDYPPEAVRELLMNAVLHRDYQSTSPTRFYQFSNRMEIQNPGGLYGEASPENFPRVTAYRNPIVAEAMHVLGYVNRFGRGIARARRAMEENGNPAPEFEFRTSHFLAVIPKHPQR